MLWKEYVEKVSPYKLISSQFINDSEGCCFIGKIVFGDSEFKLSGKGNGPIDAFIRSLRDNGVIDVCVLDQMEHTLDEGSESKAIGYIKLQFPDGVIRWGAGVDSNVLTASIHAVLSAINRAC